MYILAPRIAHRWVGYLEEEAVHTYSKIIEALDAGKLPLWANMEAIPEARSYYNLGPNATMRDVLVAVRADEAVHRSINHHLADIP